MQFRDDDNEPLNGGVKKFGNVNETQNDQSTVVPENDNSGGWSDEKKKKYIKWGIIGTIILIALTLAIVLPLTLGGGGRAPDPTPTPVPPIEQGINYYHIQDVVVNRF